MVTPRRPVSRVLAAFVAIGATFAVRACSIGNEVCPAVLHHDGLSITPTGPAAADVHTMVGQVCQSGRCQSFSTGGRPRVSPDGPSLPSVLVYPLDFRYSSSAPLVYAFELRDRQGGLIRHASGRALVDSSWACGGLGPFRNAHIELATSAP
ncbi:MULTISPECIES: hypothetical protein [unclassified Aeromicrobium]|uniref:hypothetical protein n=1 Tax=unclassified Aeromicrobium TaxID=2633570 RepID=UPI00396B2178